MCRMMTVLGVAVSGVVLLSGCSLMGGGSSEGVDSPNPGASASGGTSAPADGSSQSTAPRASASDQAAQPDKKPGTQGGKTKRINLNTDGSASITIKLNGLKVKNKLTMLTLTWTGTGMNTDPYPYKMLNIDMTLLDTKNLKRYVKVEDSDGNELGTSRLNLPNDKPQTTQDTFAAPPPEVKTIDVYENNKLLFSDVPLER